MVILQSTVVLQNIKPNAENVDVTIQVYEASIDTGNIKTEYSYQLAGSEVSVSGSESKISDSSIRFYCCLEDDN